MISAVRSADVTAFPLTSTFIPKTSGGRPAPSGHLPVRRHSTLTRASASALLLWLLLGKRSEDSSSRPWKSGDEERDHQGIGIRNQESGLRESAERFRFFRSRTDFSKSYIHLKTKGFRKQPVFVRVLMLGEVNNLNVPFSRLIPNNSCHIAAMSAWRQRSALQRHGKCRL